MYVWLIITNDKSITEQSYKMHKQLSNVEETDQMAPTLLLVDALQPNHNIYLTMKI